MRFNILTIFPQIFDSYFSASIIKRARDGRFIKIKIYDIKRFSGGKNQRVDDKPYGGGAGMVIKAEPVLRAVNSLRRKKKSKIIILSAKGRQFNQRLAHNWSKLDELTLISGRYEGIDERVRLALKAEEISLGPFVLTDGDVAAMAIISAVTRLIPGVIKAESLVEESYWNLVNKKSVKERLGLEYPHYTRPEIITYKGKKYKVPRILLSGDHKKIEEWRKQYRK